jgi:hypothetical protein
VDQSKQNKDPNQDPSTTSPPGSGVVIDPSKVPPHKRLKWIFFKPDHMSRKKWLIIDGAILLAVILAIIGGVLLFKRLTRVNPVTNVQQTKREKSTTEASHLTGLQVDPALNERPVTGVMIENSPDARPQSGLTDAGVVVEAIAEGGITRFLALYQEAQPGYIGPVRSARPYYLDFALAFNASVAHVGGSPDALKQIKSLHVRDLDQFYNPGAYQRITQRYAPHNVYTSMAKLDALNKSKGFKHSQFDSFPRKDDNASHNPVAKYINMNLSGFYYNTAYKFDLKSNSYRRSEGGRPHVDERSHKQISPKVLIAMVTSYGIKSDGIHSIYRVTGSGVVYVFQDGVVTVGKWHKSKRDGQVTFTNAKGNPIKLNAGQTWITLVGKTSDISYKK